MAIYSLLQRTLKWVDLISNIETIWTLLRFTKHHQTSTNSITTKRQFHTFMVPIWLAFNEKFFQTWESFLMVPQTTFTSIVPQSATFLMKQNLFNPTFSNLLANFTKLSFVWMCESNLWRYELLLSLKSKEASTDQTTTAKIHTTLVKYEWFLPLVNIYISM